MPDATLPDRIGRFRVVGRLGEGGMGVVYAAEDEELQREVAIKLLREEHGGSPALLREARAAARLRHPAVCTVYEVGDHAGRPFLVMERLEGETLGAQLAHGPKSAVEACAILAQTLEGLQALHAAGLVHLDLKPANIFVTPYGIKLLDFGLSRAQAGGASATFSAAGLLAGTPAYMAPEQARGEPVDARTDIFAAGIVLGVAAP